MKRPLFLCLLGFGLVWSSLPPLSAQESATSRAEREQAEERYQNTTARLRNLEESLESYHKQISSLQREITALREEARTAVNSSRNAATREDLNRLSESVKEVDRARLEDNRKVLERMNSSLTEIKKLLSEKTALPPPRDREPAITPNPTPPSVNTRPQPDQPGYEYVIRDRDTLSGIVTALRKQEPPIKVTQKQMSEANPTVNWNKLRVGQKIFIPAPLPR